MAAKREVVLKLKLARPDAGETNAALRPIRDAFHSLREAYQNPVGALKGLVGNLFGGGKQGLPAGFKVPADALAKAPPAKLGGAGVQGAPAGGGFNLAGLAAKGAEGGAAEGAAAGAGGAAGAAGPVGIAVALAAAAAVKALQTVAAALNALKEVSLAFAAQANPKVVERYTLAWDDLQAVVGRSLIPVVELITQGVRLFGDVLASVLPTTQEMRAALAPLGDALKELRDVFAELAPYIKVTITGALLTLGYTLKGLALTIKALLLPLRQLGLLGGKQLASSVGAANKGVSFTGAEEYAKSVYQAAYASAQPGEGNLPVESAVNLIVRDVAKIASILSNPLKIVPLPGPEGVRAVANGAAAQAGGVLGALFGRALQFGG